MFKLAEEMASESGYPLSLFVTEPEDDLKCLICLGVARDPLQHEECGRMFCKWCIQQHGKDKPCPNCRQRSNYYSNKRGRRAIGILKVKCSNVEGKCEWEGALEALDKHEATCLTVHCTNTHNQCEWEGTAQQLKEHLATCQFTSLPCPNGCKDDTNKPTQVLRKDLDYHLDNCPLREHQCQFCGEKGTHAHITEAHQQTCPDKPIACPECKETVVQGRKKKHLEEECEEVDLPCKYQALGCSVKMKRRDKVAHEEQDVKGHLHLALETLASMKTTNMTKTIKLRGLELGRFCSFYTSSPGYRMHIEVSERGAHLSVVVKVVNGISELDWPLIGSITVTLLNQLEDNNHHSKTLNLNMECYDELRFNLIPYSKLEHDPVNNIQYLKNNEVYLSVKVDVPDTPPKPWL